MISRTARAVPTGSIASGKEVPLLSSPGFSRPVVLIVEDDADTRDIMTFALEQRGFQTLAAADNATAEQLCRERAGKIDILIVDLSLPGEAPGSIANWAATVYPAIKIVYASGIPRHVAQSSGLVRPGAPYLEKPVNPAVLASTLTSLMPQPTSTPRDDW
jgi:DNA-binding response OmpR family regulator